MMEKQKIDEKLGKTYGAGVALEANMIPFWMKRAEMMTKTNPKTCSFYGCNGKRVTTKVKGCKHHGCKNDRELNDRIQAYLEGKYPAHYGECC